MFASVAQRQSRPFVRARLWVQVPSLAKDKNLMVMIFKKILKIKRVYLFLLITIGSIFIVGIISIININSEVKNNKDLSQKESKFLSFYDNPDYFFAMVDREQQKYEKEMAYLLSQASFGLKQKRLETEINLINNINYLLNKVEVDNNKSEKDYAQEFANVLSRVNLLNINLNDKQSLYSNGIFLINVANELAQIKPTPNYEKIHKAEIFIIGLLGYALKDLASTNDNEQGLILTQIINDLINEQNKLVDYFK